MLGDLRHVQLLSSAFATRDEGLALGKREGQSRSLTDLWIEFFLQLSSQISLRIAQA